MSPAALLPCSSAPRLPGAGEGLAPPAPELPERGSPGGPGCASSVGAAQTTLFIGNNPLQKKTPQQKALALRFWAFPLFLSRFVLYFALALFSSLEQKLNPGR